MKTHPILFTTAFVVSLTSLCALGCSPSEAKRVDTAPIIASLAPPAGVLPAATDPLVAHWDFSDAGGAEVKDSSGAANTGTRTGDTRSADGPAGMKALALSGTNGFLDVPKPVVDTTHSFTVAACVQLHKLAGFQTFVSIDGQQVSGFFLQFRDDIGQFAFAMLPTDAPGDNRPAVAAAKDYPDQDRWYHLAGVYDASAHTLSLYVDGVLQQTVPAAGSWKAEGHTAIGRGKFGGNPVDFVNGQIGDVRFYSDAMAASDIAALAKADIPEGTVTPAAAPPATLHIDTKGPSITVSPTLYGLMTEEINHSYDGGLYGELIANRSMGDDANGPAHWTPVQDSGSEAALSLDSDHPITGTALTTALRLELKTSGGQRAGVSNDGYWGIPVRPKTKYHASFYARAAPGFTGPLTISLENGQGAVLAQATVRNLTGDWRKYSVTLSTSKLTPSKDNRFTITATQPGTLWLNQVSLFTPTYKNRANGDRIDLMEKMAAMKPSFLRLPGGNYLEGNTVAERFAWKTTLGDISSRPGHPCPWGYHSTDGMGLLEYLTWCEDLKMQPVLAVFAGYALGGEHVEPGPALQPYVQEALDEIEYVTGDKNTKWGAVRAKDGHPRPFPLTYVEIGNEDFFDKSHTYDGRFAQIYDAIKAKYPHLQLIATMPVTSRTPDAIDDHNYSPPAKFERDVHHYDSYDRKGPKIFVGEWASQDGKPTPNLNSAIGDAAWLTGLERNSDIVVMEAYAPLFVNINPGASQWGTNLIGYDALNSYGSPSYYVQCMFGSLHGKQTVAADLTGGKGLVDSVTRDPSGALFIKLVNSTDSRQSLHISIDGVSSVSRSGTATVLSGAALTDTNSIDDPNKIVPVVQKIDGLDRTFDYALAPYSVAVLQLKAK